MSEMLVKVTEVNGSVSRSAFKVSTYSRLAISKLTKGKKRMSSERAKQKVNGLAMSGQRKNLIVCLS
jgi:hypothetical protein